MSTVWKKKEESGKKRRRRVHAIDVLEGQRQIQEDLAAHMETRLRTAPTLDVFETVAQALSKVRARHYMIETRLRDLKRERWTTSACELCGGTGFVSTAPYVPCRLCSHVVIGVDK